MYTTVKPSSAKKNIKKQINYDKLFAEFAKILQRDLTKEDKKIIDLAYKMGKTNQFLTESTIYKKIDNKFVYLFYNYIFIIYHIL